MYHMSDTTTNTTDLVEINPPTSTSDMTKTNTNREQGLKTYRAVRSKLPLNCG